MKKKCLMTTDKDQVQRTKNNNQGAITTYSSQEKHVFYMLMELERETETYTMMKTITEQRD